MEALKEILTVVISASLILLVFALGLAATLADAVSLLRRPRQLLRSLVAIEVVVPLAAVLLVTALPLPRLAELGIVLMSLSPLPPLVPGKQLVLGGNKACVCGLYVAVSLLAIVLVPAMMAILSAVFPADAWIAPAAIAQSVLVSVLLPLAAGMAVRLWSRDLANRAAPVVSRVAMILLALGALPILVAAGPAMRDLLGDGTGLAIGSVVVAGLLGGHLLGGPDPDDRTTLALAAATRHPGIALLIARSNFPGEPIAPALLLFMVIGLLAAAPYQGWSRRRAAERLPTAAGYRAGK